MIFIGLGSNVGDRKQLLRKAYDEVSLFAGNLKISSLYESQALLPKDAPKSWDKPFYNMVLGCEVSLNPLELLVRLKAIEKKLGRKERGRWAPREIDLDILFFKDECFDEQGLKIPHPSLLDRPFVIKPLLEIAGDMQFPLPGNYFQKTLRDIAQNLPLNESSDCVRLSETILTPDLVGILNVTPDSFSDGDHFLEKNLALAHSEKLILQGARIIDVGAESTRPGAIKISQKEEWFRLEPILENILALKSLHPSLKVSLDTRHWETAERGLKLGVDIINDVSGVSSEEMLNV
jgi:2-amino-4-hydroxy-6-hydroxymethyldihydropteridine diphosphokinase/dihydropteroate synthase